MKYDVYRITCSPNGKSYYGRSQETEKRWRSHRNMLRKSQHYNTRLQFDWNEFGEGSFEFVVLKSFDSKELAVEMEQSLIDENIGVGYNISNAKDGGDTFSNNPRQEEIRRLKSARFSGKNNPMYGKPKSELTISRIKEANSKAVSIDGVEYPSAAEAHRKLGVTLGTIYYRLNSSNFKGWFRVDE